MHRTSSLAWMLSTIAGAVAISAVPLYPQNAAEAQTLAAMTAANAQAPGATAAQATRPGQVPAELTPQAQPTHEEIADSLMAHQRYQAAIEEYKKAPRSSVEAWNKMGVAYQLMYNIGEAGRCYAAAMKLDPHNGVAYNNMGSIYMAEKEFPRAEKIYRKAVKLDPGSALFLKNLGTALLAERKYQKGWDEYQKALQIDPAIFTGNGSVRVENPGTIKDRGAMNYYMAKGCVKTGQTELAIQYLRLALNEGFTTPKKIIADAEFASLRDVPEFQKMMAAQGVYLTTPGAHSTIQ